MEFEIFRTGTHTSDSGFTKTYTEDDLNFIAASYNPEQNEAPIVIGHPIDNSPAYGWVEALKVSGDKLIAKAKQLIPEFVDAVKAGLYKKRSISLDKDGKLRHVGFLGGAAPAVKGLTDIQFSDSPSTTFELDSFSDILPDEEDNHSQADNSASENQTELNAEPQNIEALESVESDNSSTLNHNELNTQADSFTLLKSELKELKSLISGLTLNFMEKGTSLSDEDKNKINSKISELHLRLDISSFELMLNEKLLYGSFTPAMKKKIMNLCSYLTAQNFSDISFTEYQTKITHLLKDFIDSVPKIIHYENFAEKPDEQPAEQPENYSGLPVDENASALHKKALVLMQKESISYLGAILRITGKQI